jgi:K+/H+ antiporter YhaU regulatory subunit KhtT
MNDEKIKIKAENGQVIDVVVLNKNANRIEVVIGEGVHSMRCALVPTRNEMAYVGKIMGREVVYERSRLQVQADIDRLDPRLKKSR